LIYSINPIVGVIDGFRWCILGGQSHLYLPGFLLSIVLTAVLLWIGVSAFRRLEKTFADLI
jgi:lipopolysaccharide transport system permease protein